MIIEKNIIFCHEDMFLYKKPDFITINQYINLINDEKLKEVININ